jgi:uncharacterized protein YdcH (DUF465 family)
LKDNIHHLTCSHSHLARLNDDDEAVDKAVIRLETGVEQASDAELALQKQKPVYLKEELSTRLQARNAGMSRPPR